ncbi:protein phosphatase CheZ [Methylotenera mobilis]|uniref:Protein phosphatase CheZ n=1 Tax=Methylotenera mobilis (strain JLW8 / ATCC BAA-1282 / DSM 17540) TaxID=583345 RepID=C6WW55_METML|nr:protein phosphatase CheZ [Methylotenera mobilis]ACT48154.1 chemotaxis phosphatase, CheZ [Methylotenera mobilis JLW8]
MTSEATPQQASNVESALGLSSSDEILNRVGHVTRTLHDSLSGLGLDKILEQVAQDIPDARDRLAYVARMTEQAAERVLNATDVAIPLQEELAAGATALEQRWQDVMREPSLKSEYNLAATETLTYLKMAGKNTADTKALLMDIMMAQDFQDLTGQVIKKITGLAQDLEQQLVQLLIDFSPAIPKKDTEANKADVVNTHSSLLNGPQIDPDAVDVVASQEQVDDLLDSLGF